MSRRKFLSCLNTNFLSRLWSPSPQLTPTNPHYSPCRLPEEICLYPVNAVQRVHWVRLSLFSFLLSKGFWGFLSFASCIPDTKSFTFWYPLQGSVNSLGKAGHLLHLELFFKNWRVWTCEMFYMQKVVIFLKSLYSFETLNTDQFDCTQFWSTFMEIVQ